MFSSRLRPPPGWLLAIACAAALFGVANPAFATALGVGGSQAPDANVASPATLNVLADMTFSYSLFDVHGNLKGTGTVQEMAVNGDTSNLQAANQVTFLYQIHATTGAISQATILSFATFTTDVSAVGAAAQNANLPLAHQFAPDTAISGAVVGNVTRQGVGANGAGVSFNYNDGVFGPGTTSQVMIVRTNALLWDANGQIGLVDGGTGNTFALEPTPEPASLTMLGIGLVGMAGYGWHRRRKAATL